MNSLRVLVIDDNVDCARMLAQLVDLWGYETRYAFDGRSGLELAEEFHPDVVFCDVTMPGMDGCEVAKRMRVRPDLASVFVVAVTANGTEQDRRTTREAGFHLHLVKPVEPDALISILQSASHTLQEARPISRSLAQSSVIRDETMDDSGTHLSLRVLVVDDEPENAALLARVIRHWGYDVRTAANGVNALEAAHGFVPDVVLMDIRMPVLDGWEAARQLRQEPEMRDALFVALTGLALEEDQRRSREAGFDHHLVKPIEPEALFGLLEAARPAATDPACSN